MTPTPTHQRTSWAPVVALGLAMLVVTSELTMAAVTLPGIGRELDVEPSATAWILLAYALPMAAIAIPVGRWADSADTRRALLLSMTGVSVASVITAIAPTFWMLITGRLLQGLAAALITAVYLPIVSGSVAPEQRGRAIGYIITIMTLGTMAGAPIGGLVAGTLGWRGVFLIKIPLVLVVVWIALRAVPSNGKGLPRPSAMLVREGLLLGAAVAALLLAVQWIAGNPGIAAGVAVAAVALAVLWTRLPTSRPVLALIGDRSFGPLLAALLTTSFVAGLTTFLLPYFVADVLHGSPELTGLALLFFVGAIAPVSLFGGSLIDRLGSRPMALAGSAVMVAGMLTMLTLDAGAGIVDMAWRLVLLGIGAGLFNPAVNAASLTATPAGWEGTSGGLSMTARTVAMTISPAVAALAWTLAGGGIGGFHIGVVVMSAITGCGLLALLIPGRNR